MHDLSCTPSTHTEQVEHTVGPRAAAWQVQEACARGVRQHRARRTAPQACLEARLGHVHSAHELQRDGVYCWLFSAACTLHAAGRSIAGTHRSALPPDACNTLGDILRDEQSQRWLG